MVFAVALLCGIQVPSFVDQYLKRVDAHFLEVSENLRGFQRTADALFDGDLQALIDYYYASNDVVFRSDALSIEQIYQRYRSLAAEQASINAGWYSAVKHISLAPNEELRAEVFAQYSYTVPLNAQAMQWGFAVALIMVLLFDLLLFCILKFMVLVLIRKKALVT
ncbi:MAG: hypothetical protein COC19_00285 [SAR86 cluster bacterium]|uniref:DUF2937 domain-containing protein n=1 Tax=SAR86 cluster bacterium TaxID=2030880 RepID=A0A2A4MVG8_9GAMM|nr:MAG: hypothetical protein COC19_00285 [SAR86 cluster bacterium]